MIKNHVTLLRHPRWAPKGTYFMVGFRYLHVVAQHNVFNRYGFSLFIGHPWRKIGPIPLRLWFRVSIGRARNGE